MQMVLKFLIAGVLAYLIGSFPTGVILSKLWGGIDVRQVGSTHTGGMNVIRSVGIGAGILTVLVDAAKGVIAVAIGQALTHSPWSVTVTGVMATAGHCWPLYAGFHGGMGLTTLGAIFLYLQPLAVLAVVPLWFVLYIVIRHPPRTTMALMLTVPLLLWLLGEPPAVIVLGLLAGGVIFIKHIPDFNRVYD
ncbi:MAG: glycerol-3-phosphate acyltransferase [Anaerolineales bacterium]|nr:MAG: glycerol-3-phosphate acyltransferase [Anaerolineales bacterium]